MFKIIQNEITHYVWIFICILQFFRNEGWIRKMSSGWLCKDERSVLARFGHSDACQAAPALVRVGVLPAGGQAGTYSESRTSQIIQEDTVSKKKKVKETGRAVLGSANPLPNILL